MDEAVITQLILSAAETDSANAFINTFACFGAVFENYKTANKHYKVVLDHNLLTMLSMRFHFSRDN